MALTVTNIAGDEFTVEVRKNDTGEELFDIIRDAEQEMLFEAEEEAAGSWVGGSWWEQPLVMFGDVELQTIETREIPGNQTMDFVLKLGVDYPDIVDGSDLLLEVPPHPPPVRVTSLRPDQTQTYSRLVYVTRALCIGPFVGPVASCCVTVRPCF